MILLALSLGLPQGVAVLCAGPDGHLAVEFAAGPRASDDGCGCAEACGPCRDVQVGHDGSVCRPAPSPHPNAPPPDFAWPASEVVVVELAAPGLLPAGTARSRAASPPILRSVVLLI
jgi:hypothetical protein